jgi:hypothetical protein
VWVIQILDTTHPLQDLFETSKGPVVGSVILWGASVNPRSEYVTGGSTAAPLFKNIVSNLVPGE